jgi:hypothetical protein
MHILTLAKFIIELMNLGDELAQETASKDSANGQTDNRAGNLVYAKWPIKGELPRHDHFHAPSRNQSSHHARNPQTILEKRKRHDSG